MLRRRHCRGRALAFAAALACAAGALAQGGSAKDLFARLDRDGSGDLSGAELAGSVAPGSGWIAIDRDGDQRFSREEFQAVKSDAPAAASVAPEGPRGGYSARRLIGVPARDSEGRPVGVVREVLLSPGGAVTGLMVDDRRVPWTGMSVAPDAGSVTVPEPGASAGATAPPAASWSGEWRASDFFGGTTQLERGARYAKVEDLIITPSGEVRALIVDAGDGRRHAYPWRSDGLRRLQPFDYGALGIAPPR